jgi:hypothetical protein
MSIILSRGVSRAMLSCKRCSLHLWPILRTFSRCEAVEQLKFGIRIILYALYAIPGPRGFGLVAVEEYCPMSVTSSSPNVYFLACIGTLYGTFWRPRRVERTAVSFFQSTEMIAQRWRQQ